MPVWYIIRGGNQYGPYSAENLLMILAQNGLYPQDVFLNSKSGRRYAIDKAVKIWRKTAGPKKRHKGLIVFGVIVLLIGGFIGYKLLTKTSDHLTLGSATTVASETVSAAGGSVTVSGGELDGFSIDIPDGAYGADIGFKVSTRPIEKHTFGALFDPVTPLITVDNGHAFAKESMTVTIPIELSDDEFAMGFYYDQKTGDLEGIPLVSEDTGQITLLTNHFSDILVSKVKLIDLEGVSVDTAFLPGYDDWQFTNYGSFIASGGHCAGQSVSAMWYFEEMYADRHYPRLYGEFDDYGYPASTKDFWRDDSWAYRFASVIQTSIDWEAVAYKTQKKLTNVTAIQTMNAFIYTMKMTGEPQFLEIWGTYINPKGKTADAGHAIVAYKVEDGRIYVADPNYPGADDRCIQLSGGTFDVYSSGTNAAAIESGYDIAFTDFYYIAQSSLIDYSLIEAEYDKMIGKTVGNGQFPDYKLQLMTFLDEYGNSKWTDCPEEIKVDSAENVKNMGEFYRDKIAISVTTATNLYVQLYSGLNDAAVVETKKPDANGNAVFTIKLKPGINDIGFYVFYPQPDPNNPKYVQDIFIGFTRVKVEYDLSAEMKFQKDPYDIICEQDTAFNVTVKNAPPDVTYEWDFGDGTTDETEEPSLTYAYTAEDDYTVTCTMVSNKDGKVLAEAWAAVSAVMLYGDWQLSYTITEAGAVNYIANFFGDMILGFFKQIFPDEGIPDSANITIEGTVITGTLTVSPPDPGTGKIPVVLQQESSSTDFVDVETTPIRGYLKLDGDKISIILTGDAESGGAGALTFDGYLNSGSISGTFSAAGMFSGDFTAKH